MKTNGERKGRSDDKDKDGNTRTLRGEPSKPKHTHARINGQQNKRGREYEDAKNITK